MIQTITMSHCKFNPLLINSLAHHHLGESTFIWWGGGALGVILDFYFFVLGNSSNQTVDV